MFWEGVEVEVEAFRRVEDGRWEGDRVGMGEEEDGEEEGDWEVMRVRVSELGEMARAWCDEGPMRKLVSARGGVVSIAITLGGKLEPGWRSAGAWKEVV